MDILLIGSGGREHSLAQKLAKSDSSNKIYVLPGNPGTEKIAINIEGNPSNFEFVLQLCQSLKIDLVVVGPEQYLAEGIADMLRSHQIAVFGPDKFPAQLESSKVFAKKFMQDNGIPTAEFRSFSSDEFELAQKYLLEVNYPIVLKADGLAAGKGVIICNDSAEAVRTIGDMFEGLFSSAGRKVVIEEFMAGEEASILAICDGKDYTILASSQDHKRAFDNDLGPNTGGMGAYAPAPIVTNEVLQKVEAKIIQPVLRGMQELGHQFIGCLYCGLMIDNGEPKVVEFNARFGDPETQPVLEIFEGDFAKLLHSAAIGNIDNKAIRSVASGHAVCIVMAAKGYPGSYMKGYVIDGINEAKANAVEVYHAGTKKIAGKIIATGGRVIGVTARAKSLNKAIERAYNAVEMIKFDNAFYRKDIGRKALKSFEINQ